jgi:hypothetical protein
MAAVTGVRVGGLPFIELLPVAYPEYEEVGKEGGECSKPVFIYNKKHQMKDTLLWS